MFAKTFWSLLSTVGIFMPFILIAIILIAIYAICMFILMVFERRSSNKKNEDEYIVSRYKRTQPPNREILNVPNRYEAKKLSNGKSIETDEYDDEPLRPLIYPPKPKPAHLGLKNRHTNGFDLSSKHTPLQTRSNQTNDDNDDDFHQAPQPVMRNGSSNSFNFSKEQAAQIKLRNGAERKISTPQEPRMQAAKHAQIKINGASNGTFIETKKTNGAFLDTDSAEAFAETKKPNGVSIDIDNKRKKAPVILTKEEVAAAFAKTPQRTGAEILREKIAENNSRIASGIDRTNKSNSNGEQKIYSKPVAKSKKSQEQYSRGLEAYQNQDYSLAFEFFRQAAEYGNVDAQNSLGGMYEYGLGTEQDYELSLKWCKTAAEKGNALAQYNLACKYVEAKGVKGDLQEAIKWYQKAAQQGFEEAKKSLERLTINMM